MDKLLTKKDLAERFQVSTTTIGRWDNGFRVEWNRNNDMVLVNR